MIEPTHVFIAVVILILLNVIFYILHRTTIRKLMVGSYEKYAERMVSFSDTINRFNSIFSAVDKMVDNLTINTENLNKFLNHRKETCPWATEVEEERQEIFYEMLKSSESMRKDVKKTLLILEKEFGEIEIDN